MCEYMDLSRSKIRVTGETLVRNKRFKLDEIVTGFCIPKRASFFPRSFHHA